MKTIKKIALIQIFLLVLVALGSCSLDNEKNAIIQTKEHDFLSLNEINAEKINESLRLAGQWLINNQNADGSLRYLYYPTTTSYSSSNNMIRQYMATVALAELYQYTGSEAYKSAFDYNMRFNFANYYEENGSLGYIAYENEAKLGAAAIALMAILESKHSAYQTPQQRLTEMILFLHNETDGSFTTFYFPKERRGDNEYFYPGEAMLALMKLYLQTENTAYLETVKKSFDYYSMYFEDKMNPAFIPWHTMADYYLYLETGNETYANYILEINDWLLKIQNKNCSEPRHLGRFYDPEHEEYGPPHASSDGVYVEGLSYAYRVAALKNDTVRMDAYKEAMLLGARSLLEMQFTPQEAAPLPDTAAVLGGFRTSTTRDEIRIDNTQHAIMALLGILETLSEEEIKAFVQTHPRYLCD